MSSKSPKSVRFVPHRRQANTVVLLSGGDIKWTSSYLVEVLPGEASPIEA